MTNNKKPSEPLEPERWVERRCTVKNPLTVQILALCISI